MRLVIQRVRKAQVEIENKLISSIQLGLLVLLGIEIEDKEEDIDWLIRKLINLRIFSDENDKMNLSIQDVVGEILLVSQFTLYASTKKGNRPSYIRSARPDIAIPLYELFINKVIKNDIAIQTGEFGADMQVSLLNDGPVTIIIDSKNRE